MKLKDVAALLKTAGKNVTVRIDDASQELISEAILLDAKTAQFVDVQSVGTYIIYYVTIDNVSMQIMTAYPLKREEVKEADYYGLSLEDYRKTRRKDNP